MSANKVSALTVQSVGIDFGGTWLRVLALDKQGNKVHFIKSPSCSIHQLPNFLESTFKKWRINRPRTLIIGAKGVWTMRERKNLNDRLKDQAREVFVFSDVEMAYHSLLGNQPGILILAGTGSIAMGKDNSGNLARAGGLGPENGDHGSAYWIGKKIIKLNPDKFSEKSGIPQIAALASYVIARAKQQDESAEKILKKAQHHLLNLAIRVLNQLEFGPVLKVGCSGGLFQDNYFRKKLIKRLRERLKNYRLVIFHSAKEIVYSTAQLGLRPGDPPG